MSAGAGRFSEPGSVPEGVIGADVPAGLVVTVLGKPITQGSKTRTRWGMRDDNGERLRPWREAVKAAALDAMDGVGTADPIHTAEAVGHARGATGMVSAVPWSRLEGPVLVDVSFWFDPPKSGPKWRRLWPITRSSGDVDKLVRAVFDALVDAGVMRDDSQVVTLTARKAHVGDVGSLHVPGAHIEVWAVSGG